MQSTTLSGRIIRENKTNYLVAAGDQVLSAVVRGSFHIDDEYPKVGDYVEYTPVSDGKIVIERILPRRSVIVRKAAGSEDSQVIVANVDLMLIVMGLDNDFNLGRLERYQLLASQSGVRAVIVLNKSDLAEDSDAYAARVRERFVHAHVLVVSAATGDNMLAIQQEIGAEDVAVLLGSSGAGKSTITNWLLSDTVQKTGEVRGDDSRGRHSTTARELFTLPRGGYLIDTPGMRELGLVGEVEGELFADIEALIEKCEYHNCDHEKSAGCAVRQALEDGVLSEKRLESYRKLQREKAYLDQKLDRESKWKHKKDERKVQKKRTAIIRQKREGGRL